MKQPKKKPTLKQVESVVSNLIMENRRSQLEILRTQKVLDSYIEYNKDKEKFTKYMEELHGKSDKKNNKSGSRKK